MKELVEAIAKALVDHPEDVQVRPVDGSQVTVLELRVHPEDLGKVIGRQGRTAKAIRTLLGASGMKLHKRFTLEILEDRIPLRKNKAGCRLRALSVRAATRAKSWPSSSPIFPRDFPPACRFFSAKPRTNQKRSVCRTFGWTAITRSTEFFILKAALRLMRPKNFAASTC